MTAEKMLEEIFIENNVAIIDDCLENLSSQIGRQLTANEEEHILDIVDEFTPLGDDGNYLCSLIPFDYAWQIYQARQLNKIIF